MLPLLGLVDAAKGIAGKIADTVQGKQQLIAALAALESGLVSGSLEYELKILQAKKDIVLAEANSQSWIARNWRPSVMLWSFGLVTAYWFGLTPASLSVDVVQILFEIVKYGLTGYVVGRSAEKVVRTIAPQISGMRLRRKKD